MANSKISALTSATTPLAGTEVLPIVQSSTTVKVAANDLTVKNIRSNATTGILQIAGPAAASTRVATVPDANFTVARTDAAQTFTGIQTFTSALTVSKTGNLFVGSGATTGQANIQFSNTSGSALLGIESSTGGALATGTTAYATIVGDNGTNKPVQITSNGAIVASFASGGNITASAGNIVQGTAAKGFDFSANTPLAGKTSTILNWYEEGTWTPNQGAGLTLVGAFSSTGKYTRIGRNVTVSGTVTGATSVAVTAAGVVTSNLPFTVGTAGHGNATNAAVTASAVIICTGTSVTSAAAIAATGTITFSATYFV